MSLQGKVALITGGSRGIGRATALALARSGADVVVNFQRAADEANAAVAEIHALGRRAVALQADVSDPSQVAALVADAERSLGSIDILVNNAGVLLTASLDSISLAVWRESVEVNLTSAFLVTQAVLPGMRTRRWGRLIFMSSIAAQTGGVVGPHYAASKAGMLGLMRSYANLLAAEGITSNAIAPALIDTEMVRNNLNVRPDMLPVGRFGTSEEVADAAVLLATNGYITGQTLNLNGGWYKS
jgi:3-oxoacyl-[acyl-carrier protein] reductase